MPFGLTEAQQQRPELKSPWLRPDPTDIVNQPGHFYPTAENWNFHKDLHRTRGGSLWKPLQRCA